MLSAGQWEWASFWVSYGHPLTSETASGDVDESRSGRGLESRTDVELMQVASRQTTLAARTALRCLRGRC